jgi:hypothetical protein
VLCARGDEEALGCGAGRGVGSTLIEGPSALGVLEGERDSGKGMTVGSISAGGGTLFSSSSDSPSTCSSSSLSPSGGSASCSSSSSSPSE